MGYNILDLQVLHFYNCSPPRTTSCGTLLEEVYKNDRDKFQFISERSWIIKRSSCGTQAMELHGEQPQTTHAFNIFFDTAVLVDQIQSAIQIDELDELQLSFISGKITLMCSICSSTSKRVVDEKECWKSSFTFS